MATHIPNEVFEVYHRNKGEFITALKAAVLLECQYDALPEVFDIFGNEALKFVEIFSGRTVKVPAVKELVTKLRQVGVYVSMGNLTPEDKRYERMVEQVAARFSMRKAEVRQTHLNMKSLMDNLAMELRPKPNG